MLGFDYSGLPPMAMFSCVNSKIFRALYTLAFVVRAAQKKIVAKISPLDFYDHYISLL